MHPTCKMCFSVSPDGNFASETKHGSPDRQFVLPCTRTAVITQVIKIGWLRLWHGRFELLLVFVVPLVFFTIFALIFDKQLGSGKTKQIDAAVVDLDQSPVSQSFVKHLVDDAAIRRYAIEDNEAVGYDQLDAARDTVLRGDATVAVVIPEAWAKSLVSGKPAKVWLLADASDPIGPGVVEALVQKLTADSLAAQLPATEIADAPKQLPLVVETIDVLGQNKTSPVVSMYAAGIAVMFLLFSATGHAGSLIEERENQTLERLLCSQLGMGQLLVGKWAFLAILGVVQIVAMFAWAQLVFGVRVSDHLAGFAAMTAVTAAAAASLALVMATACRSRAQLNAVSVIAILTMSALGGSMVPRYLMSETMQNVGKLTFNAWAIDGYQKLFWRNLPVSAITTELAVLGVAAVVMLIAARVLARRWEVE